MHSRMSSRRKVILFAGGFVAAMIPLLWSIRHETAKAEAPRFGVRNFGARTQVSTHSRGRRGEAATGWYAGKDVETSVGGALEAAQTASGPPDFVMIVFGSGAEGGEVLSAARRVLGARPRIFGLNSHIPEILDPGSIAGATKPPYGVAALAVRSPHIRFGVGAAEIGTDLPARKAAREAVRRAFTDAGKTVAEPPRAILLAPTRGCEEDAIAGIEDVVGKSIPIFGGTAGPKGYVVGGDVATNHGVSVALIFTRLTLGWTFEAGYDVSLPKSGIVTRTEGRVIAEIDHRPAWDVYNEWLDGRLTEAVRRNVNEAGQLLALNPCYRQLKAPGGQVFALFSHAWPERRGDRWVLAVSTSIQPGDRIHLSHGTWELLMNRVANLPRAAKARGGIEADEKPLFGLGFLCAGVAGVLPVAETSKLPMLLSYGMNGAPYLPAVTGGEQGFLPGIGNKHANLSTGFLVVRDGE